MKIGLRCPVCKGSIVFFNEVNNDGVYTNTCIQGHKSIQLVCSFKFQTLFEHGLYALLDGYYAESIFNISASLERFFEMSIKIFMLKNGIDVFDIEKHWSFISSQSERQKGAYYFLYLNEYKEVKINPEKMKPERTLYKFLGKFDEWSTFRNKVIHKGYIPTEDECFAYVECAYNYIMQSLNLIKGNSSNELHKLSVYTQKSLIDKEKNIHKDDCVIYKIFSDDVFDMVCLGQSDKTFQDAIDAIKRNKRDVKRLPLEGFYTVISGC